MSYEGKERRSVDWNELNKTQTDILINQGVMTTRMEDYHKRLSSMSEAVTRMSSSMFGSSNNIGVSGQIESVKCTLETHVESDSRMFNIFKWCFGLIVTMLGCLLIKAFMP